MSVLIGIAILVAVYFLWGWLAVLIAAGAMIAVPLLFAIGIFGIFWKSENPPRKTQNRWPSRHVQGPWDRP